MYIVRYVSGCCSHTRLQESETKENTWPEWRFHLHSHSCEKYLCHHFSVTRDWVTCIERCILKFWTKLFTVGKEKEVSNNEQSVFAAHSSYLKHEQPLWVFLTLKFICINTVTDLTGVFLIMLQLKVPPILSKFKKKKVTWLAFRNSCYVPKFTEEEAQKKTHSHLIFKIPGKLLIFE
jgi:hypothetical protein